MLEEKDEITPCPLAEISGFKTLSLLGPRELNEDMLSSLSRG
jgi:hypothetical protein